VTGGGTKSNRGPSVVSLLENISFKVHKSLTTRPLQTWDMFFSLMSLNVVLSGLVIIASLLIREPPSPERDQSIKLPSYALLATTMGGGFRFARRAVEIFSRHAFPSEDAFRGTRQEGLGLLILVLMDIFSLVELAASIFILVVLEMITTDIAAVLFSGLCIFVLFFYSYYFRDISGGP
jgi:hypothetical protein